MKVNKNDNEWKREMYSKLNSIFGDRQNSQYISTLFDPVQTHSLSGITSSTIDEYKEKLKKLGANKFRTVSNGFGFKILCFNATKIELR